MNAILARILDRLRNEPALLGAAVSIAGTLGATVPAGAGWEGVGLAVGEFVVGLVVRHFVVPSVNVQPIPTPPVVPHP
jgi:hypothetical protein